MVVVRADRECGESGTCKQHSVVCCVVLVAAGGRWSRWLQFAAVTSMLCWVPILPFQIPWNSAVAWCAIMLVVEVMRDAPAKSDDISKTCATACSCPLLPQLLTAIQRELGDPVGRMASRLTPSDMPGSRGHDVCAQLLQALFTDLAVHNDATQPYNCTMGGDAVSLAGRLPYFPRALKHHAELREAQAELADKPFLVSIYMVSRS